VTGVISRLMLALVFALFASVALAGGASSPSDPKAGGSPAAIVQDRPFCKRCVATGRLPCTEHARTDCELEDTTEYCSFSADCPVCGGVGWTLCPECKPEEVRAAIEKKRASVATRKTALKWLDDKMGHPLHKAESAHFVLVFELDKIKVDKKYITSHEGLHLYVKRLEALYDDYLARMMITAKEFVEKFRVFMWYLPQDHKEGSLAFCGQNASGGVKLMGMNPSYSVCCSKQNFQDDEKLHRNIVHSVTHLLLSAQRPAFWIGNVKGGWADEGLSHWFEDRYWNICDNYCYQEANTNVDFKGGKFRLAVRKLVESEKLPSIAEVVEQNIDTLTLPMHALAFSYVDYFISRDGAKFSELLKELKKKVPTRDAIKKVYGINLLDFEAQWKVWVLQTYPTK